MNKPNTQPDLRTQARAALELAGDREADGEEQFAALVALAQRVAGDEETTDAETTDADD